MFRSELFPQLGEHLLRGDGAPGLDVRFGFFQKTAQFFFGFFSCHGELPSLCVV